MPMAIPIPITPPRKFNFIEKFAKQFCDLLNDLGIPGKNQLDNRYFYENCTMSLKMHGASNGIREILNERSITCFSNIAAVFVRF